MKELITTWDLQKNREAREERRKEVARLPPPPPDEEEQQPAPPAGEAPALVQATEAPPGGAFAPPPRPGGDRGAAASPEDAEAAAAAARAEAAAKAKAAKEAAHAERERLYQEALAEIKAQHQEDGYEGVPLAELPPPLTARVVVYGAREERLNGEYHASFAAKDRVEFQKEDDPVCQIFWTQYHDEWRMLIGDYKLGSTLYRHKYRPNLKVDADLGIPLTGWQKWFGKEPCPRVRPAGDVPPKGLDSGAGDAERAEAEGVAGGEAEVTPAGAAGGQGPERLEICERSALHIVQRDAPAAEDPAAASSFEVRLHDGERLVETAEGLFSPGEVPVATEEKEAIFRKPRFGR